METTTDADIYRAVKRTIDLLRPRLDRTSIERAVIAWAVLWQAHHRRPDLLPDCLRFEQLANPHDNQWLCWPAAAALDQQLGANTPLVAWLVLTREPNVQRRLAELWGRLGDHQADALGVAYMALLNEL